MRQIPVVDPAVYQARRRKSGLVFGLLCGLAFAVATWGIDGLLLSQSHAYLPWFKFLIGIVICAGLGALTGWIAAKMDNALLSAFFWLVTAGLFSVLTGWLSYSGTQTALKYFLPQIAGQVSYNPTVAANFRIGFAFLGVGLAGVIVGFIELPLVDTAATSASRFSRWLALSVGVPVFLLAGIAATDGLINAPLRAPIVAMHDLLQFAQANQGKKLESSVIRETHYAALNALGDEIYQPYRMALKSYDDTFSQVNVLVAFKDGMAVCSVYVGTPSYCQPGVGGTQSQSQPEAVTSPTNLTQVTPYPDPSNGCNLFPGQCYKYVSAFQHVAGDRFLAGYGAPARISVRYSSLEWTQYVRPERQDRPRTANPQWANVAGLHEPGNRPPGPAVFPPAS